MRLHEEEHEEEENPWQKLKPLLPTWDAIGYMAIFVLGVAIAVEIILFFLTLM